MQKQIVILASHGVQALDVTGPASVFSAANEAGEALYDVVIASPAGGLIRTHSAVAMDSCKVTDLDPDAVHTLLVAGHDFESTQILVAQADTADWVRRVAARAPRWGSVCSGTFPLAAWGLLGGKKVVTHWLATELLADSYPDLQVQEDALFVVDGNVWTSAGVTSGIDMALAIVEADLGADVAAQVARRLVVYLRRPGSQSQFSEALASQQAASAPYADLIAWARDNLHRPLTVEVLAGQAAQSPRTFQRKFSKAVGKTPAAFVEELRIERAKALIDAGLPLKQVAGQVGYPSASQLTIAFRRKLGVAPSVWKAMHGSA